MKASLFEKWAKKHIDRLQTELDYRRLKNMIKGLRKAGIGAYIIGASLLVIGSLVLLGGIGFFIEIGIDTFWWPIGQLPFLTKVGMVIIIFSFVLLFFGKLERLYADELEIQADYWYKQYQKSQEK